MNTVTPTNVSPRANIIADPPLATMNLVYGPGDGKEIVNGVVLIGKNSITPLDLTRACAGTLLMRRK